MGSGSFPVFLLAHCWFARSRRIGHLCLRPPGASVPLDASGETAGQSSASRTESERKPHETRPVAR